MPEVQCHDHALLLPISFTPDDSPPLPLLIPSSLFLHIVRDLSGSMVTCIYNLQLSFFLSCHMTPEAWNYASHPPTRSFSPGLPLPLFKRVYLRLACATEDDLECLIFRDYKQVLQIIPGLCSAGNRTQDFMHARTGMLPCEPGSL